MSLYDPLFNYCERLEVGLLAEPLNALSNAAFFLAAWFAYKTLQKRDPGLLLLITLITIVGIGSFLFHTFANRLTMLADVIPITLFVLCYLYISLRRLVGATNLTAALCIIFFVAIAMLMGHVPEPYRFNGSVEYFPCLIALLLVGVFSKNKLVLRGAAIFALSLSFRSIDFIVCQSLPTGTHFIWHALNGLLLYTLVKACQIGHAKNSTEGTKHG